MMWLQKYALGIVALLSLMNPARAQIGGVCSCSPRSFRFTLDFSLTCPPVNVAVGTGIAQTSCAISNLDPNPVGDTVPVEISEIEFLEFDQNFQVVADSAQILPRPFADGDVVDYTSITADPRADENPGIPSVLLPRGLQLFLFGRNSDGEAILNTWNLQYTNDCNVEPILSVGDSIGWTRLMALEPPRADLCPAVETPAPTVTPTKAPVTPAPTVTPTTMPVTSEPTVTPTTMPDTPPPTGTPTTMPVTSEPTVTPTTMPDTPPPTVTPTTMPDTPPPTVTPTTMPVTSEPTGTPTTASTGTPTTMETPAPTVTPTTMPDTPPPTVTPTEALVTREPTVTPTTSPTGEPTKEPTEEPSVSLQPTCKNGGRGAGCGGDPHFNTFTGKRFSYHGMCDIMLVSIKEFLEGRGLKIFIRTTHDQIKAHAFSFISVVAMKLGNFVLEISADNFYLNNATNPELPLSMGDGVFLSKFTELIGGLKRTVYEVDMVAAGVIRFIVFKKYILVSILEASELEFANSVGMLGSFNEGQLLARDGLTIVQDVDEFGNEWQVRPDTDGQLFREIREPQYPMESCRPAEATNLGRRRLRATGTDDIGEAEAACAHRNEDDFEDFQQCVFDVLATGDVEMAIGAQF